MTTPLYSSKPIPFYDYHRLLQCNEYVSQERKVILWTQRSYYLLLHLSTWCLL